MNTGKMGTLVVAIAAILGSTAEAQFKLPKPPSLPKPPGFAGQIGDRLSDLDRRRLEEQRKLQAATDRLRTEANRVTAQFRELQERARRNQELPQAVADLNSPDRATREKAYAKLRRENWLHSNKAQVERGLHRPGVSVIYGVELDHYDQRMFVKAVAASVVTGNPGPVLVYLKAMLMETAQRMRLNLVRQSREVADRVMRDFEMNAIRALQGAIESGRPMRLPIEQVHVEMGLATYNNWIELVYDEPRLIETRRELGIPVYRIELTRKMRTIPTPNTFQPYFLVRFGSAVSVGSGSTNTPANGTRLGRSAAGIVVK